MANKDIKEIVQGDSKISFQTQTWAEQANASCLVQLGDTVVLVTAVMSPKDTDRDYFPLMVDFEEKFYSAGRILGSRFVRREGRPSDESIIAARVIDRALRPLFPKELKKEVQVIATVLSFDSENDPDILGLLGASLALKISDIPWNGPLGAARVGKIDGTFVLNPTYEQRGQSTMDFIFAGVKEGSEILVNMIECESKEATEQDFNEALAFATPHILSFIDMQEKEQGKEKVRDGTT